MPGPNSAPNGQTNLIIGHIDSFDLCNVHGDKRMDECLDEIEYSTFKHGRQTSCKMVPLRMYLFNRNRLQTGKTSHVV